MIPKTLKLQTLNPKRNPIADYKTSTPAAAQSRDPKQHMKTRVPQSCLVLMDTRLNSPPTSLSVGHSCMFGSL